MSTSEQARSDALADAETLVLYYCCAGFPPPRLPRGQAAAILKVFGTQRGTLWQDAPNWAVRDAREAFRVVPGLRG